MTRTDNQLLFTALGFLTVLMKGESTQKDGAARATAMASVIELFCRATRPDLFEAEVIEQVNELDEMIESLKNSYHARQLLGLTSDPALLHRIYGRLQTRHRAYATDDLITDEVVHLLEEEIKHAAEANMMVVHVHGKSETFAPYERLATAIVKTLKTKGECTPKDLSGKDFSQEEVQRNWAMAHGLAKVELNWMDS